MKFKAGSQQEGNALLGALCTITVVSLIGANVLLNCTSRLSVSSNQVRSWKESLYAAEAGGDIAYAELRKTVMDPTRAFTGWTNTASTHMSPLTTFGDNSLSTSAVVDHFYDDPSTGNAWYRVRSKGTAPVLGVRRTGMDDRMGPTTRGDSLLRKIDFNYDHFVAAYGPAGDGAGKALVAVNRPQITRRIEQIGAPMTPFEVAIKCSGSFYGLGSAAQVDSFNSRNGPYYFCANNPADPHFSDSRSGSVAIGTPIANVNGMLYGNISTNGGTIVSSQYISGNIDNNVPFTIPPYRLPGDLPLPQPSPTTVTETTTINPPASGNAVAPTVYLLSTLSGKLTINPVGTTDTYVAIHVTGDVTGQVDVKPNVHAKLFVEGNMSLKARDINNESGIAANLQYYAISPTNPATVQTIDIAPPGNFAAVFYAPSADVRLTGNPDITGAIVCKTFYGNGNTSWHYDRALDTEGEAVDYRIVSYVEDTR